MYIYCVLHSYMYPVTPVLLVIGQFKVHFNFKCVYFKCNWQQCKKGFQLNAMIFFSVFDHMHHIVPVVSPHSPLLRHGREREDSD